MQDDETISTLSLVQMAAEKYGMSVAKYLKNMRQEGVWGGGPEIVALANWMERQIVLLEPMDECNICQKNV